MADKSQHSVRDFFTKVSLDKFRLQDFSSNTTTSSFIPPVIEKKQKEYQKNTKRQNMKDLYN